MFGRSVGEDEDGSVDVYFQESLVYRPDNYLLTITPTHRLLGVVRAFGSGRFSRLENKELREFRSTLCLVG